MVGIDHTLVSSTIGDVFPTLRKMAIRMRNVSLAAGATATCGKTYKNNSLKNSWYLLSSTNAKSLSQSIWSYRTEIFFLNGNKKKADAQIEILRIILSPNRLYVRPILCPYPLGIDDRRFALRQSGPARSNHGIARWPRPHQRMAHFDLMHASTSRRCTPGNK